MAYRLKNLRVLVVDGNAPIRSLVRSLLLDLGFGKVDQARDARHGWVEYREARPDAILLDWRMNDAATVDFIRKIRTHPDSHARNIPIIVMTGQTNRERVFQARDIGATEFLIKPFSIATLTKYFANLIDKPRDFVMAPSFVGPDRRRRQETPLDQPKRRADKIAMNVPVPENPDVLVVKASFDLKIKAGSGGFDRGAIVRAEKRLAEAVDMFSDVAAVELDEINEALRMIEDETKRSAGTMKLVAACIELRAHGMMFQFPLVGIIAEKLLAFCSSLKIVTPAAAKVIVNFLHAFRLSIDDKMHKITPQEREALLRNLDTVTEKILGGQVTQNAATD